MATFNYYLRDSNTQEKTPIVLYVSAHGIVSKIRTGESIEPKYWDKKKQQVKKQYVGSPELNEFLSSYSLKAQAVYRGFTTQGLEPSTEQLRQAIELPKKKSNNEFKTSLEGYIETNKENRQPSTIRRYQSLKNHLQKFQEVKRKTLSFDTIDLDFFESFQSFLVNELKQNNNTVCKYVKTLKSFMQWAHEREIHKNTAFKRFKVKEYAVEIIYLTDEEISRIYNLDLTNNKTLDRVRDAFCFGCFTGQRFSDIYNISWDAIKNGVWYLHTKKTKEIIEIPLNKHALNIIQKYKDSAKPVEAYSNQKMNDYLKVIGKMADLSDTHKLTSFNGNRRLVRNEAKHDLISTHTARRTFVTLSLEKGMRPETVMEITGHKDYKTMKRYIKITSKVKEAEMKKIWNQSSF